MDLNEELEQLRQEAAALRKEVGQLKDVLIARDQSIKIVKLLKEQCEMTEQLDILELTKNLPENIHKLPLNLFPIKSQEDLEAAEIGITEENRREYIALAKALLMPGSFKKNLNKILSLDVILEYNVDGRHNRRRIQDYPNLLDVLYRATSKEGCPYKYFLDELRIGFKCAKNKQCKVNWVERKKHTIEPSIKIEEVLIPYDDE